jgi:hypothetical protein
MTDSLYGAEGTTPELEQRLASEYGELCNDWRHRDGMLWQSLAVSITVTGLTLGSTVSAAGTTWAVKAALFFLALLLNLVVLLKIVKDNYYQHGSSELIGRMQHKVMDALRLSDDKNLRIRPPSASYADDRIKRVHPRWLFDWLTGRSTFQWFFAVQLFLVVLTLIGVVACTHLALLPPNPTAAPEIRATGPQGAPGPRVALPCDAPARGCASERPVPGAPGVGCGACGDGLEKCSQPGTRCP